MQYIQCIINHASSFMNPSMMKLLLETRNVSKDQLNSWLQQTVYDIIRGITVGLSSFSKQLSYTDYLVSIEEEFHMPILNNNAALFPQYKGEFSKLKKN